MAVVVITVTAVGDLLWSRTGIAKTGSSQWFDTVPSWEKTRA